jgi:hypothetical protein
MSRALEPRDWEAGEKTGPRSRHEDMSGEPGTGGPDRERTRRDATKPHLVYSVAWNAQAPILQASVPPASRPAGNPSPWPQGGREGPDRSRVPTRENAGGPDRGERAAGARRLQASPSTPGLEPSREHPEGLMSGSHGPRPVRVRGMARIRLKIPSRRPPSQKRIPPRLGPRTSPRVPPESAHSPPGPVRNDCPRPVGARCAAPEAPARVMREQGADTEHAEVRRSGSHVPRPFGARNLLKSLSSRLPNRKRATLRAPDPGPHTELRPKRPPPGSD